MMDNLAGAKERDEKKSWFQDRKKERNLKPSNKLIPVRECFSVYQEKFLAFAGNQKI